jgi:hypothetical protein
MYICGKRNTMKKQTVKILGREIPLTKSGNINKTYLSKEERKVYNDLVEKKKKEKKEIITKDLEDFFGQK